MTPRFKKGDKISNGKIEYSVIDIVINQNGIWCYKFKNIRDNDYFLWQTDQVDKMFELVSTTSDNFDWQSFRAEAAKDILCSVLPSIPIIDGDFDKSISNAIINSINTADELIKQLKEKEEK